MIHIFELVCKYLELPISMKVFFHLFTVTCPSGSGATLSWLSFRAHVNRKIFNLYEDSHHNFKVVFFKINGASRSHPFFLTSDGSLRFPCY